jgi:hypothetical protein
MKRNISFALLGGTLATLVYWALSRTTSLHGFAIKALGPAISLVERYLDPTYSAGLFGYLEELAMNVALYSFWIFVILTAIDLLRQLKTKPVLSK